MDKSIKSRLHFVYSKRVADYLINERGLQYVTYAKHPETGRLFWIFERGTSLDSALSEYSGQ
jgi:hypothetical protein